MQYVVPILVGIIASLLAPIVQNIMQAVVLDRAARSQRRRDLVDEWRAGLAETGDSRGEMAGVRSSRWYERLRPYLSGEDRKQFEHDYPDNASITVLEGALPGTEPKKIDRRAQRNVLAKRVDELTRAWKVD
ncbi:hypothetical protein QX204_24375 [Nocardia sp. PE-7]|uniref:hypothetical protein n=1 Tax=Nocardia sp. PE-7 TaxID=3058426 RepID=UPI00265A2580|nr:hypothetical protein [Nocardia sp. PE-7]WKG08180.1 hypothetical protein QX204_24375 [Nocardia sp. PE-7]